MHFLRIAEHGYSAAEVAFYPLYPGLVAGVGMGARRPLRAGGRARLAPSRQLGAFVLLERIAEERLGGDGRAGR